MKASDLKAIWEAPDNSRLMKKQTSVRLATHIGARISALCELYPSKSKSQIINDLLAAALHDFESGIPFEPGKEIDKDYDDGILKSWVADVGTHTKYLGNANKYLMEYEKELGNEEPKLFFVPRWQKVPD